MIAASRAPYGHQTRVGCRDLPVAGRTRIARSRLKARSRLLFHHLRGPTLQSEGLAPLQRRSVQTCSPHVNTGNWMGLERDAICY
ncbi:hypothetical protein BaRGS_00009786 [Batillaria attramentaria]|uniref:Uncharacterized protein n=1 Tax=Batillaria attramentaria TaxID=370345 RepID=A0ABD0LHG3_9CAEN